MQDPAVSAKWISRRRELWLRQVLFGAWLRRAKPLLHVAAWIWRRLLWRTKFIAITGSLGKTTAKEMLAAMLSARFPTYWTIGNQNGPFYVALNILRVRPWHRYAVIETAGAAPGVMQRSAPMVRPDMALMLTIRRTHSTAFASLDEHAREKVHLIRHTAARGTVLLFEDDPRVSAMEAGPGQGVIRYGVSPAAQFRARNVTGEWPERLSFDLDTESGSFRVRTQLVGKHWLHAALGALAAGVAAGVPVEAAISAAAEVAPFRGRLQPVLLPNGATVLRDDYNASLDGSDAAFEVMRRARAARRVAVISDLSDFGGNRKQRLKYIAALLPEIAELAVVIGESADYAVRRAIEAGLPPERVFGFSTLPECAAFLKTALRAGDLVLLKGRTTDHLARVFFAQFARVDCWKTRCPKTMLCDECWELGVDAGAFEQIRLVPAPGGIKPC